MSTTADGGRDTQTRNPPISDDRPWHQATFGFVARKPAPPLAAVISFIDCINRTDLDGLVALMTDDHALVVLTEAPLAGRDANREAWNGYFTSFPDYVIYPRHIGSNQDTVAVFGNTTGSHLGLSDAEELQLDVVWMAEVIAGKIARWCVAEDSPELRREYGIPD